MKSIINNIRIIIFFKFFEDFLCEKLNFLELTYFLK